MAEQRAIVTGAAQGIGRVTALALGGAGYAVGCLDWNLSGAEATADRIRAGGSPAAALGCDVSREPEVADAIRRLTELWGGLDLLVNCAAAIDPPYRVAEMPLEVWERTFSVALTGTFLCCKHALQRMLPQRSGCIINLSSVAGKMPYPYRAAYAAAKAGVQSLTRTLAMEVGPDGIRVNALCPGPVEGPRIQTVFEQRAAAQGRTLEAVRAEFELGAALRQLTQPEDVAALILFLASPAAARITGQLIDVDAGYLLK